MNEWNICRICSCPGEYDIYNKIPSYLHGNSNEFLNWQKPINSLIEDTTGLKILPEDGLPNKICALCVSYLKHAASFRDQVINNNLSLKAIQLIQEQNKNTKDVDEKDKDDFFPTPEIIFSQDRQADANLFIQNCPKEQDKVCKQLLNNNSQTSTGVSAQQHLEQQIQYLNLLFDKDSKHGLRNKHKHTDSPLTRNPTNAYKLSFADEDFETATSSDDVDKYASTAFSSQKQSNMFSYAEKNVEEDDVLDMEELRKIVSINIPETCKERKCRACSRRFMFEDSYNEHVSTCIEYKFLTFIEEINFLLDVRRNKGVSPHEFIRRMIFILRKTCEWLRNNYSDALPPEWCINNSTTNNSVPLESDAKSSATSSGDQKETDVRELSTPHSDTKLGDDRKVDLFQKLDSPKRTLWTPISFSNNILYEIERSQSCSSNSNKNVSNETILASGLDVNHRPHELLSDSSSLLSHIPCFNDSDKEGSILLKEKNGQISPMPHWNNARKSKVCKSLIFDEKTDAASNSQKKNEFKFTKVAFTARCDPCGEVFETLSGLEQHNAIYHNFNCNKSATLGVDQ